MTDSPLSDKGPGQEPRRSADIDYGWVLRALPAGLLTVVFIVFAVQNAEDVTVEFLWWSFTTPRILVLIGAAVVGALIWELLRTIRRRRKRHAA